MSLRPDVCLPCSSLSLRCKCHVVAVALQQTCALCHHSGKVVGGGHALGHYIAGLMAVCRLHEPFKVWSGELMIHAPVFGILHREQPLQVEHHLVEQVGSSIAALRNVCVQLVKIVFVLLIDSQHQTDGERRVHHIFVVVAGIIPAEWRTDDAAGRTSFRCCRRMDEHIRVEMSGWTGILPCIFLLYGNARAHEIEQLERGKRHIMKCLRSDDKIAGDAFYRDGIASRHLQFAHINNLSFLFRPGGHSRAHHRRFQDRCPIAVGHRQLRLRTDALNHYYFLFIGEIPHLIHVNRYSFLSLYRHC